MWQHVRLCARVAAVAAVLCLVSVDDFLTAVQVLVNLLLADWLMFSATCSQPPEEEPRLDEHSPALAVVLSRLVAHYRDGVDEDYQFVLFLESLWCTSCLLATFEARQPRANNGGIYRILNAQFLFVVCLNNEPMDSAPVFAARAGMFAMCCSALYLPAPRAGSGAGSRGYLACFLPLLVVSKPTCVVFSGLAWAALAVGIVNSEERWAESAV